MTQHNLEKTGVLLLNVGSPDAPETGAVRRYLRQFLSDPRVFDVPAWKRKLILELFILPFRPRKSAEAYRAVWTKKGSPLIAISQHFAEALSKLLPDMEVTIGMAYGRPSIRDGFKKLLDAGATRIVLAPMFPQYASATTGSVLEAAYTLASKEYNVPSLITLPPYYGDPGFLDAWATVARPYLQEFEPDHVLMSYHGLPERQILKGDPTGEHCLKKSDCCEVGVPANVHCYRRHCMETNKGIVDRLMLDPQAVSLAFQSRLGRDPWLTPSTEDTIRELAKRGVKRLAVLCPAFTIDCLETLEEIALGGKETFVEHGGEAYVQIPCLNTEAAWVRTFAGMIARQAGVAPTPVEA
jgi:ferrochelatase